MVTQSSQASVIYSTRDYDLFKFYKSNRPAEHWPKIAKSIEQHDITPCVPIIVNKDFYIIDGQNRFMACKHLKKPVFYVIGDNVTDKDIALLNSSQKNWVLGDYMNFYVSHNVAPYVRLETVLKETGLKLAWVVGSIWQGGQKTHENRAYSSFKDGGYTFPEEAVKKCRLVSSVLFVIENSVPKTELKNLGSLISAISSIISNDINASEMISKLKKYPFLFKAQADQVHYKELLETIYNYRNREKVSFKYR